MIHPLISEFLRDEGSDVLFQVGQVVPRVFSVDEFGSLNGLNSVRE